MNVSIKNCQCVQPISITEKLLELADLVLAPGLDLLVVHHAQVMNFGRIKTALKLRKNPVLAFRAMVEEWDGPRIVREVY